MVGWGTFLIILGAGSVLLPKIGFQFLLMELVGGWQPYAGIVVALMGSVLVIGDMARRWQVRDDGSRRPVEGAHPAGTARDDATRG